MQNVLSPAERFHWLNFVHTLLAADVCTSSPWMPHLCCSLENLTGLPTRPATPHPWDICDVPARRLFQRYTIDTVVHFAAETHATADPWPGQFIQTMCGHFYLAGAPHAWHGALDSRQVRFHHVRRTRFRLAGSAGPALLKPPLTLPTRLRASKAATTISQAYFTLRLP